MFIVKTMLSRYAGTVMEVCKVNEELNKQLLEVSTSSFFSYNRRHQ